MVKVFSSFVLILMISIVLWFVLGFLTNAEGDTGMIFNLVAMISIQLSFVIALLIHIRDFLKK